MNQVINETKLDKRVVQLRNENSRAHQKKRKIVFVTQKMIMGGIEKALLAMLASIPPDEYEVTLIMLEQGGALTKEIPAHVKIKYILSGEKQIYERCWENVREGKLRDAFNTVFYTMRLKNTDHSMYKRNVYLAKSLPFEQEMFDVAIAYHIPTSFSVPFVIRKLQARKKIAWIHSDVSDADEHVKISPEGVEITYSDDDNQLSYPELLKKFKTYYEKYDQIFCVSKYSLATFTKVFPNLQDKTNVFYNVVDEKHVMFMAEKSNGFDDDFGGLRILTVGRLGWEKGQDIIPSVLVQLIKDGYPVRWYCIGDGALRGELEKMIETYSLQHELILLGEKENPYPYFKDCDIYVQPSRQEGYCLTVAEARAFNKPIITTNTGASEQIRHEQTGFIVEFDKVSIMNAIKYMIDDEQVRNKLTNNLCMETTDTTSEMKKLYQFAH